MTLSEFLLARLAEVEALARAAARAGGEAWEHHEHSGVYVTGANQPVAVGPWDGELADEGPHIARHDPAYVLADVEAKRRIVELHADEGDGQGYLDPENEADYGWLGHACSACGHAGEFGVAWPCPTLRLLAGPFADHPDYDEAWRPE